MTLNQTVFKKRRAALSRSMKLNSIAVLFSAPLVLRNGDIHFPYRQNSNFYYLSGFKEPRAVMLLYSMDRGGQFILFNETCHPQKEIWNGRIVGQARAIEEFGADEAYPIDQFESKIKPFLKGGPSVYVMMPKLKNDLIEVETDSRMQCVSEQVRDHQWCDLSKLLHEQRLIKSEEEIALIRKATEITVEAHYQVMQVCQAGMNESDLEAELCYQFSKRGARYPAYPPIVASGAHACILHYIENNALLQSGELVLIDAGAEYGYYSADVTRTFPVSGVFSEAQKQIYQLVLEAQISTIELVKPGLPFKTLEDNVLQKLTEGLVALGMLKGEMKSLIDNQACRPFYMHGVSHWLGLDTHDVGDYQGKNRCLEPGMVLTIEPGLYFSSEFAPSFDKMWANIGVRIEDDVLVTETGHDVLSHKLPKTIEAIETLMAGRGE